MSEIIQNISDIIFPLQGKAFPTRYYFRIIRDKNRQEIGSRKNFRGAPHNTIHGLPVK